MCLEMSIAECRCKLSVVSKRNNLYELLNWELFPAFSIQQSQVSAG
jgi:hypothetical protein